MSDVDKSSDVDKRNIWLRAAMMVVPTAVGVPLLMSDSFIWYTLGSFACLLALYALLPELSRYLRSAAFFSGPAPSNQSWQIDALCIGGLALVSGILLWPCLVGMMPQSQDHTVHLTRAWQFLNEMLAHGRLSGWSDLWFAGWPSGEDYPPGSNIWITAFYLATFGLLGWEATYGIAFWAMFFVSGYAIYYFGKTYFNRTAGFIAALCFFLDRGQYREGGWSYTVWWGVWPQVLSTSFTFLSFALIDKVLKRGMRRDYAWCALATGMAIITHPMSAIYFGIGVPVLLISRILGTKEPPGKALIRALGAFGLGAALAAFWIVPFSAKGSWMAKYGELWKSLPTMAQDLWRGTLFDNLTPGIIWLGLLGGAVAVWRRNHAGIFLAIYGAMALFLASSTAFEELKLISLSPSFGQIQFQRLSILVKVCFFLLAGFSLYVLFQSTVNHHRPSFSSWRRYILVSLAFLVVSPLVMPLLRDWGKSYGEELGRPKTRKDVSEWKDYQKFLQWSAQAKKDDPQFYRIAYVRPYNDHFFAAAPVYNHTPAYKVGYTPATNFIFKPDVADPELYRLLSVKYVVTLGPLGGNELAFERNFGSVYVYRFKNYSTQRYTLEGPGQVEVQRFDTEHMQFKLSGTSASSRLILHVANYPNWRAYQEGKALPIETAQLGVHKIFLSVPARDGQIEIKYGWPAVNIVSSLISWLAVAILGLMALLRFRPKLKEYLERMLVPWGRRAEKYGVPLFCIVMFLPVMGLGFKTVLKARKPDHSLTRKIPKAQVEIQRLNSSVEPCHWDRGDRWQCSAASWNYVGLAAYRIGDEFRRCLWAHPIEKGKLRIRFPAQVLGRTIDGHHGFLDTAVQSFPGGAPVTLEIEIGNQKQKEILLSNTKGWFDWHLDTKSLQGQRADLTFVISTGRAAGRHYCFDAAIEP